MLRSALALALLLATSPAAHAQLAAAVLPSALAVEVDAPAVTFATIINAGAADAVGCSIAPATAVDAAFTYQVTEPTTNQPIGTPNVPVGIPAGASRSFVLTFTPNSAFDGTLIELAFDCANTVPAPSLPDVNTFRLAAGAALGGVIAIAATVEGGGVITVPETGYAAFSVAAMSIGPHFAAPPLFPRIGVGTSAPVAGVFCETDPATGACVSAMYPVAAGAISVRSIPQGGIATYSIFLRRTGSAPFDPATQRVIVAFLTRNALGGAISSTVGSASVAVKTAP